MEGIEIKIIQVGDMVKFYDCDRANKDRDYSGKDQKYYPIGEVIKSYQNKGGWHLLDIQLPDGRISYGHFISGVVLNQQQSITK